VFREVTHQTFQSEKTIKKTHKTPDDTKRASEVILKEYINFSDMSKIKTILEEIAIREGKDILDVTQDELDVFLRNKHGRKTRFDHIMEDLEKEGKVHNIEDVVRNNIFTSLRTVMDEHNHSEKIREGKTLELLNRIILK
jgi:hypothetical protein